MRFCHLLVYVFLILYAFKSQSQTINWKNISEEKPHLLNVNAGLEYGVVYGLGYGRYIKSNLPILLNAEYSAPAGENIFDDLKLRIGGRVRLYSSGNFQFSANAYGVFRRYENDYARLVNFGSEISGVAGYYKSKWFLAAEVGFDKAVVTHFKHTDLYKLNFPGVKDGWYEPSTGGNFYYGIQSGFSFKQSDIYIKLGKLVSQDFLTNPNIPFYASVGYNFKMKK
jgi:hypothetical protein